jgi:hypothetical protein
MGCTCLLSPTGTSFFRSNYWGAVQVKHKPWAAIKAKVAHENGTKDTDNFLVTVVCNG